MHTRKRQKTEELRSIIQGLHDGLSAQEAKARFDTVVGDVSPEEIGAMEEVLIQEGVQVSEIQRLCDLHLSVVKGALDNQEPVTPPPGHPAHTYMAANQVILQVADRLGSLCAEVPSAEEEIPEWWKEMEDVVERISGVHLHYLRKENELFPALERHGITGPSQVMWGVHDQIRGLIKRTREASEGSPLEAASVGAALARSVTEMVYKENKILLPMALEKLSEKEWAQVRRGEDELGYAFAKPAGASVSLPIVSAAAPAPLPEAPDAYLDLGTGKLTLQQVDMILRHLPVDLSFVDSEGFVRYYSETEDRLFPRTPGAIGRHVTNCHPPKSVHMVEEILRAFQDGEREVAEFWIRMGGRFIHIRYFAVRSPEGKYLGCLEVSQDATAIRGLEGERRLLEWQ